MKTPAFADLDGLDFMQRKGNEVNGPGIAAYKRGIAISIFKFLRNSPKLPCISAVKNRTNGGKTPDPICRLTHHATAID